MKLIIHTNNIYTRREFFNFIFDDQVSGASFDIILTKDNKIILYDVAPNSKLSIGALEQSTLEDLETPFPKELDGLLKLLQEKKYKKKIFFHLIPISFGPITDDNLLTIRNRNYNYVKLVYDIARKYPDLNLYFSSLDQNVVYFMKEIIKKHKIGITLENNNFNYMDVDFYEFPTNMLDSIIINQQLNLGKEVSVIIRDDADITLLLDTVLKNELLKSLFPKININTTIPHIVEPVFQKFG